MQLIQYCIKVFTKDKLQGNPAAVILLNEEIGHEKMQRIAFINNYPETVFLKKIGKKEYFIYWFTPTRETYDAGHATIAAQYFIAKILKEEGNIKLIWKENDEMRTREFDSKKYNFLSFKNDVKIDAHIGNKKMFNMEKDIVIVLDSAETVKKYKPNFEEIIKLEARGLCITALGINNEYCSRFFAPKYGVNEDFVTATSHKYLSVYWSNKLNTNRVKGIQYSQSYGEVIANVSSEFIELEGNCCIFSKSEVFL
ncbi:PhzF family phenazine biosynthesis protein [Acinetobacter pittii]|uniref:PhzF family phenazine biosynthesis protein n=1 Tax=Acinetobacter pittii TaxID=48296 RepID=UPI00249F3024|nr:PhzF family phenazine biosynthesis protein [Acinetobacter pittii]WHA53416.1 hypothetical protein OH685_09220 [Acinetobacter pittii]